MEKRKKKRKLSWFVARGELSNYYKIIFFSEAIYPNLMLCLTFKSTVMVKSVSFITYVFVT